MGRVPKRKIFRGERALDNDIDAVWHRDEFRCIATLIAHVFTRLWCVLTCVCVCACAIVHSNKNKLPRRWLGASHIRHIQTQSQSQQSVETTRGEEAPRKRCATKNNNGEHLPLPQSFAHRHTELKMKRKKNANGSVDAKKGA